jgi:protein-S-isoprenylcysteine O-methyltransferase Ste14
MNMEVITITLSALWLSSEIILSLLKRAEITDKRLDKSSFKIVWIAIAISVATGVSIGFQPFGHFGGDSEIFPIAGVALMIFGIVVRWYAIFTLKRRFTVDVAITADHRLIKEGIYHYVRHPAYAGSLLSFFGLGLVFANYLSIITIFIPICSALLYRIHVEEKALITNFGDEYINYRASTKRLIPHIF